MSTHALNQPLVLTSTQFFRRLQARVDHFRIKNHLRLVERSLRRQDVSHLALELQERRRQHLDQLHTYWQRGVFPQNIYFQYERVPFFKDHLGTPCAMAYLMEQAGQSELVATVARNNNYVYIEDVHSGPVLTWIKHSGLTQAEAAQIQPTYDFEPYPYQPPDTAVEIILKIVPWLFGGVALIALEWISYAIVSWLPLYNMPRKVIVWLYLTAYNVIIAFGVGLMLWVVLDKITSLSW